MLGKRMADHLRMAVCYWHTFCSEGADMFGPGTFGRPWNSGPMDQAHAEQKLSEAFEFWFVRRNRGSIPVRVTCQVSDRAQVRGSGTCETRRIFSW